MPAKGRELYFPPYAATNPDRMERSREVLAIKPSRRGIYAGLAAAVESSALRSLPGPPPRGRASSCEQTRALTGPSEDKTRPGRGSLPLKGGGQEGVGSASRRP